MSLILTVSGLLGRLKGVGFEALWFRLPLFRYSGVKALGFNGKAFNGFHNLRIRVLPSACSRSLDVLMTFVLRKICCEKEEAL